MKPEEIARLSLAAVVVIGFSAVAVGWMYAPEHSSNRDILLLIIGSLCTGYGTVLGYFFSRKEAP
jgi:hypothetical protein